MGSREERERIRRVREGKGWVPEKRERGGEVAIFGGQNLQRIGSPEYELV